MAKKSTEILLINMKLLNSEISIVYIPVYFKVVINFNYRLKHKTAFYNCHLIFANINCIFLRVFSFRWYTLLLEYYNIKDTWYVKSSARKSFLIVNSTTLLLAIVAGVASLLYLFEEFCVINSVVAVFVNNY